MAWRWLSILWIPESRLATASNASRHKPAMAILERSRSAHS